MKIKELKEKLEANTSEKLFGIDEQPEQNCPKVDKGLKAWYSVQRDIEGYCKDLKRCDTVEEAEKIGGDIDWAIGSLDVVEEYEELRKQCEKIRAWGQGWKDLAKKLIEQQEDVSNLLADEFYVKLEAVSSVSVCTCEMPAKVKSKNECWRCKKPFKEFLQNGS